MYFIGTLMRGIYVSDTRLGNTTLTWIELGIAISLSLYIFYLFYYYRFTKFGDV